MKKLYIACAFGLGCLSPLACATEGGGSTYLSGADNFLLGAAPPPGLHVLEYGGYITSNKFMDNSGNAAPIPGFKVSLGVAATRLIWSTPSKLGNLLFHTVLPLVDLKVEAGGASQHKTGLGDITFGPALATHYSEKLHSILGVDFVAPTGEYNKNDLANIGRNHWSIQPLYTMSYIDPNGFNGDFKATLNINQKNTATNYKSGTEFNLDYTAGYGFGNGWVAGVSGYWYQQIAEDSQNGVDIPGSKGRGFAIGPSVKYDSKKGWIFTAKFQKEFFERNRTQGNALWIRTTVPF